MKKYRIKLTTQYTIIVCILLVAVNVALGVILMSKSGDAMKSMTQRHMLAVADTAAASLDASALASVTAEDVDSEVFKSLIKTLTSIKEAQKDSDIKYIYTIKKEGDKFVFVVDADPLTPAAYGDEVVYTPAQDIAWNGVSAIDEAPYEDKWGSFYTAWSPIRESGKVIGIVGVDFVPDWYDEQVASHTVAVIIFSALSLLIGALIMVLMTRQLRKRIRTLDKELLDLSSDVNKLFEEIRVNSGETGGDTGVPESAEDVDTISALSYKIQIMQQKLKEYVEYARERAYTDSMTGVGNKTAYLEYIKEINRRINEGVAAFAIAVFDINGLKSTNDIYGHECGDRIIIDAASVIKRVFSEEQIYRIGGDEFITVLGRTTQEELKARFDALAAEVDKFNSCEKHYAMTLSFSWGGAVYKPGRDSDYKEVFKRADEAMYKNKGVFYKEHADYRRLYDEPGE